MSFWFAAALMTLGACAAVLWPFLRHSASGPDAAAHDLEVYRDQLRELERDAERGMIGKAEAAEARAEIGRRILKAADAAPQPGVASRERWGRVAASVVVLAVPLVAWGGYAMTGSPGLPDQALADRLARNPAQNTVDELIARAEMHLRDNPADGRGWEVLAPIYLRTGRPADAVMAWRNAIRLSGASAAREAGLGEALVAAASGTVTVDAEAAFGRALALDPAEPRARYFTALGKAQGGRADEALADWTAFAAELPAESPWQDVLARAIDGTRQQLARQNGPSTDDVAAAEDMPAADRQAMIEGMVASLDARLRENPADAEGWQRLVRSYQGLGNAEAAGDALTRGVAALGEGSQAASDLVRFAASIGIERSETQ